MLIDQYVIICAELDNGHSLILDYKFKFNAFVFTV